MNSAIERLLALRVGDVMTKHVMVVTGSESMTSAAHKLLEHSVSGAPVVDENRRCTGVLTAMDFVKGMVRRQDIADSVAHRMTSEVHSISASESLMDAARMMCLHHIHRLVILDRERHPIGVITSLDLVAAMVQAIEE